MTLASLGMEVNNLLAKRNFGKQNTNIPQTLTGSKIYHYKDKVLPPSFKFISTPILFSKLLAQGAELTKCT